MQKYCIYWRIIQHSYLTREILIRKNFCEFLKTNAISVGRFKYHRREVERMVKQETLHRLVKETKYVCSKAELSKGALCRCRVKKECLKKLYANRALVKGLRGIGLCVELNMTVATAESWFTKGYSSFELFGWIETYIFFSRSLESHRYIIEATRKSV